jgi:hypothetical protein
MGAAGWFGIESRRQANAALARQLVAQGTTLVEERPLLGLRMMLEGLSVISQAEQESFTDLLEVPLHHVRQGRVRLVATDGNNNWGNSVHNLDASPDGSTFFLAQTDQPGELHHTQSGEATTLSAATDWVTHSPYGPWAAIRYPNHPGELRHLFNGDVIQLPGIVAGNTYFSPDGEWVIVKYGPPLSAVPELSASGNLGTFPAELRNLHTHETIALGDDPYPTFGPQGTWVLLRYLEGPDSLRNLQTGEIIQLDHEVEDISFNQEGTQVVVVYENQPPERRNLVNGAVKPLPNNPAALFIASRGFDELSASWAIFAYEDQASELRHLWSNERFLLNHSDYFSTWRISSDQRWAVLPSNNHQVYELWDLQTGVATTIPGYGIFSRDSRWHFVEDSVFGRQLRDLQNDEVFTLPGISSVDSLWASFSPDSRFLWTNRSGVGEIWELEPTPRLVGDLGREVTDVFVYTEKRQALVAYEDGRIYQIDLALLQALSSLEEKSTVEALFDLLCEGPLDSGLWTEEDRAALEEALAGRQPQACQSR